MVRWANDFLHWPHRQTLISLASILVGLSADPLSKEQSLSLEFGVDGLLGLGTVGVVGDCLSLSACVGLVKLPFSILREKPVDTRGSGLSGIGCVTSMRGRAISAWLMSFVGDGSKAPILVNVVSI